LHSCTVEKRLNNWQTIDGHLAIPWYYYYC
jgi:hypothetical protein